MVILDMALCLPVLFVLITAKRTLNKEATSACLFID